MTEALACDRCVRKEQCRDRGRTDCPNLMLETCEGACRKCIYLERILETDRTECVLAGGIERSEYASRCEYFMNRYEEKNDIRRNCGYGEKVR